MFMVHQLNCIAYTYCVCTYSSLSLLRNEKSITQVILDFGLVHFKFQTEFEIVCVLILMILLYTPPHNNYILVLRSM